MKVLRLCSVFQPPATALTRRGARFDPIGGMQTHTHALSAALDEFGVRQTIVTTRPPSAPDEEALGGYGRIIRLGLPVRCCRQLYSWPAARLVPRLAADVDLLHAHVGEDLAVIPIAISAVRRHGLPLVLTVHTSVRHTLAVSGLRSAVLKSVGGALERWGAQAASAVIVLTPRLVDLMRSDGVTTPIRVIPSGVAPALFDQAAVLGADPLAGIPRPRVVFVGRLHAQKQVDVLVRATPGLPQAQIVLVGDGPERGRLERLSRQLNVADRVHFRGFLSHDRVPSVLHAADVLTMPSRYEELGTALLEGMQAGLPIVASDTGGIPNVIKQEQTGLLVPPGDPQALARALTRVLADREMATRLGEAARRQAARYHWPPLATRVLTVYREALAAGRHRPQSAAAPAAPTPQE